jgi:hypothetical protein
MGYSLEMVSASDEAVWRLRTVQSQIRFGFICVGMRSK